MMSFGQFGNLVRQVASARMLLAQSLALRGIGEMVKEDAQGRVGSGPGSAPGPVGPFPGWAPLADSTVARKGFDNILLETGDLQDSIDYALEAWKVTVGTDQDYAIYTELGTSRMPPRPIFGPSFLDNMERILPLIGEAWIAAFVNPNALTARVRGRYQRGGVISASGAHFGRELTREGPNVAHLR